MTDERVEPTKEWLDALIEHKFGVDIDQSDGHKHIWKLNADDECIHCGVMWTSAMLTEFRDAILASQPERVECDEENHRYFREDNGYKFCPECGQSLKGAGE